MKLKVQCSTAEPFELKVEDKCSIRQLKKHIYRSGKITGAVRIVKGQDVLPDDSTLVQHNITDGTTVNIVIEPDKKINFHVKCGSDVQTFSVPQSSTVHDLKKLCVEKTHIFSLKEIDLVLGSNKILEDSTVPLYYYGVSDGSLIDIVKSEIGLVITNKKGHELYLSIEKRAPVAKLREIISKFSKGNAIIDLYSGVKTQTNWVYRKLVDDDVAVGDVLYDHAVVYVIETQFCADTAIVTLPPNRKIFGVELGDTIFSVKLRAQDQLGISTHRIIIKDLNGGFKVASNSTKLAPNIKLQS